jgi:hypothetical protein
MKKVELFIIGSLLSMALLQISCERPEGEGGKASIEGIIYKIVEEGSVKIETAINENGESVNKYSFARDTIPAAGEDVYIIYGKDTTGSFDNRERTSYNGRYKFINLTPGNYNVFAYDNLPDKKQIPHIRSVKVGNSGKHLIDEPMYIMDGKNVGLSAIVGKIKVVNKTGGENPGAGLRVYINGEGYVGSENDVRADGSGTFIFTRVKPGIYDVWAESEPVKDGPIETVHVMVNVKDPSTIVSTVNNGDGESPIELTVVDQAGGSAIEGTVMKIIDDGNIARRAGKNGYEYYFVRDTVPAAGEDVYIIYGDDPSQYFEERERTSYNGKFRFRNLIAGNYTIFAYDNLPNKKQKASIHQITLQDNEVKTIQDTMYIRDGKNAGLSAIRGRVNLQGSSMMGCRVYIKNTNYENITDDVRTDDMGFFVFKELEQGEYEIWAESEPVKDKPEPSYYLGGYVTIPEGDDGIVVDISANPIEVVVQ